LRAAGRGKRRKRGRWNGRRVDSPAQHHI
jgi:hypothetical protein